MAVQERILATFLVLCVVYATLAVDPCTKNLLYVPQAIADAPGDYNICLSPLGYPVKKSCPVGYMFNAETWGCSKKTTTSSGDGATSSQSCAIEGQYVAVADSTCMKYAVCSVPDTTVPVDPAAPAAPAADTTTVLTLNLKTCASGEIFNPFSGACETGTACLDDKPDCDADTSKGKNFIDVHDCNSFYSCQDDIRIKDNCPSGYEFEPYSQICVAQTKSICSKVSSGSASASTNVIDLCKGSAQKFVVDPDNCRAYYYCIDEKTPYWDHCLDDKYFNNGYCTLNKPSTCTCEDADFTGGKTKVLAAHPDKTQYYVCSATDATVTKSCPSGYTFDVSELSCTH